MRRPFHETYASLAARFEDHLPSTLGLLPDGRLREAVSHVLLGGGKRLRPVLCLVAAGIDPFDHPPAPHEPAALAAAAAIEWMHTYSLVHDDLPSLDDDDWRRGRPTLHRMYDEATAILAGDALHAGAFALAAAVPGDAAMRAALCGILGRASVAMVVGQMRDTLPSTSPGEPSVESILDTIDGKTGALIAAALSMGAVTAGTANSDWDAFGRLLGRMFQVKDDLLDRTGSLADLGKTPGKDDAQRKINLVSLLGPEGAGDLLEAWRREAVVLAGRMSADGRMFADEELLIALAGFIAERTR